MADPWTPTFTVQDVQQQQMNRLTMQEQSATVEAKRGQAQEFMSRAAKEQAQARKIQTDQETQMRVMVETKGQALEVQAKALIDAGQIDAGAKLLSESARIINQLAQADEHRAQTQNRQFDQSIKLFDVIGRAAERITNDDEYQAMLDKVEEVSGKPLPAALRQAKWSPETKQRLIDLSMSTKDRIEADRKAAADRETAKLKDAQRRLEEARTKEVNAKTEAEKARAERLKKLEGGVSKVTPPGDVKTIMGLIRNDYPSVASDDPGAAAEASFVAARAQTLLQKNPGMSRAEALGQSYMAAKANGEISTTTKEPGIVDKLLGNEGKKTAVFKPVEGKPAAKVSPPAVGAVMDGFKFKGGDPADQNNWEKQ